ncbi:alpha/beta fold hydrolase [Dongia soli]|uniref:Alpha/beta fold hydrolase n=1 Tax=Dongia soli TaxID=600628 RepID=A0ABU5EDE7_9PROT|nr:alpha/beta fold hydrolase [Dongia soli]MDY0884369.1 alpha/beta fold hydrolase [Dongia soli]
MDTDQFATLSKLRVRYRLEGKGPVILLIHGVGGSLNDWNRVAPSLIEGYTVLRCDLRGHGQSEKLPGPYELEDFVADVHDLVRHLKIDRFHLAGFSLGGLVVQGFALAHPEMVDHLILLSTVAGRTEEEKKRVLNRLDIVANGIPGQHFENSVSRWFTDEFRAANPDIIAAYAKRSRENDPKAYAAAYRVLATGDLADRLHEIKVPTLVATAENDIGSNPRMAKLMHERIAGSKLHIFPRLRHSILTEAPQDVVKVITDFLPRGQ